MISQYPRLFNALPSPGFILLPDFPIFTIQEVNDAFLRATNTEEKDWLGKSIFNVPAPLYSFSITAMKASLVQVLKTKEAQKMQGAEYELTNYDTALQPITSNYIENIPLTDDKGEVTGILQLISGDTKLKNPHINKKKTNLFYQLLMRQQDRWLISIK